MERYNLEEAIKILGLEMRAEMAHEGVNFDVACRTILKAVRKSEKIDELEDKYFNIAEGRIMSA
jgi:hypothetical protein